MSLEFAVSQLRHAYTHLKAERVVKQVEFADGLIAPAIRSLERHIATLDAEAERARLAPSNPGLAIAGAINRIRAAQWDGNPQGENGEAG